MQKILIAVSGQPSDQALIDWLRQLNLSKSVKVYLVRILWLETLYRQDIRRKASQFWTSFVKDSRKQLLEHERQVQSGGLNTESHLIESGHIGEALNHFAQSHDCDLILTGYRDNGLLKRMFLGSTSRYVLRHSQCSVLIVRKA